MKHIFTKRNVLIVLLGVTFPLWMVPFIIYGIGKHALAVIEESS